MTGWYVDWSILRVSFNVSRKLSEYSLALQMVSLEGLYSSTGHCRATECSLQVFESHQKHWPSTLTVDI